MPFTDVADSATTIAATQVKQRVIYRHKDFPMVTIETFIKMSRKWSPFCQSELHLTGKLCTFLKFCLQCNSNNTVNG